MNDVYLFELASQRTAYLSARQTLIAGNVANANTPAYKALDLKPFSAVLAADLDRHGDDQPRASDADRAGARPADRSARTATTYATVSGNSVDLEGEMMKLGEVNRDFGMATGVKKIFHQMFMQALK